MRKIEVYIIVIGVIVWGVVTYWQATIIRNQRSQISESQMGVLQRTTLEGEYTCLQPKNPSDTKINGCISGIRTSDGTYYALDFRLTSQSVPKLTVGDSMSVSGVLIPIEQINTGQWQRYENEGILWITDSVHPLNN